MIGFRRDSHAHMHVAKVYKAVNSLLKKVVHLSLAIGDLLSE